ncbi:MAG: hypothetical protein RMJ37_06800, partial [Spirochaetia bacterium]|nr:hypothetical protein [Spirochaetota bacterium]MDW8113024.1 hypothetical protein [Spirochaetia bacterium]
SEDRKYYFLGDPDHVLLGTNNEIDEIKVLSDKARVFYIKSEDFREYFYDYPVILPRLKAYS